MYNQATKAAYSPVDSLLVRPDTHPVQTLQTTPPETSVAVTPDSQRAPISQPSFVLTWRGQTSPTLSDLNSVFFADPSTGVIVGDEGTTLWTKDGGATWSLGASGPTRLLGVFSSDAHTGTAVGYYGTVLRTFDGARTWRVQRSGSDEVLHGALFTDALSGVVVGFNGVILHTKNGGATWTRQVADTLNRCEQARLSSKLNKGMLVGGYILRLTRDEQLCAVRNREEEKILTDVVFTDALSGFATATGFDWAGLLRTSDGGATWSEVMRTEASMWGVSFTDSRHGVAVGCDGTILYTDDSGASWRPQEAETTECLEGVFLTGGTSGVAVGGNGTILRLTRRRLRTAEDILRGR